jgi:dihydroorotate dehydrogenase (fumarate)
MVRRAKKALAIRVIANLNCTTQEGWSDYARALHQPGADAIELNIYFISVDVAITGREDERVS